MSVASSSEWNQRVELMQRMRIDLQAAGVPREAWPRRLPRTYGIYTIKSPVTGVRIQVMMLVERFLVPVTVPPRGHSVQVPYGGNPEAAWETAKALAGW